MRMRSAALLGLAAAASASPLPVSLWTSKALSAQDARRMGSPDGLNAVLTSLVGAAKGRSGKPARITVLAEPQEEAGSTIQQLSSQLGSPGRTQLSAAHKAPTPLLSLASALGSSCDLYWVAGAAGSDNSLFKPLQPAEYAAAMEAPASSLERCTVYVVGSAQAGASSLNSVAAVEEAIKGATAGVAQDGVLRVTAVVAWPGRSRGQEEGAAEGSVESEAVPAAAAAAARRLQDDAATTGSSDSPSPSTTPGVMMVPAVMEGLIIGFGLVFFALVGLYCVLSIRTPDVLHSFSLPAGKEY